MVGVFGVGSSCTVRVDGRGEKGMDQAAEPPCPA